MPLTHPVAPEGDGRSMIPVAMETFTSLAEAWKISTDDQIRLLGSPGRSTFFKWKKEGGSIPRDALERISHLLGIYKCLEILLPDETAADDWVKKPNGYFGGQSALDVMLGGGVVDIYRVRQYLDAQRGG
jgi:hypothetical protein